MGKIMKTKEEVREFLNSLVYQRISKGVLQSRLQSFLGTTNKLENATDEDCKEVDYSYIFTNGDFDSTRGFIDVEIYYLKTREKGVILITGSELLMYEC